LRDEYGVMMFSGSAVADTHNTSGFGKGGPPLVAIFTGHGQDRQTQDIAFSNGRGRTWTKYAGNPVLDLGEKEFRDPKVFWHEPTKRRRISAVVRAAQ
jgi:sucrose-6-phosphate hydrolase SacC (GH32 family)